MINNMIQLNLHLPNSLRFLLLKTLIHLKKKYSWRWWRSVRTGLTQPTAEPKQQILFIEYYVSFQ